MSKYQCDGVTAGGTRCTEKIPECDIERLGRTPTENGKGLLCMKTCFHKMNEMGTIKLHSGGVRESREYRFKKGREKNKEKQSTSG